ncbi:hypothetical protein [uncultured Methanocorpusculum sp.]|nr:hypothetical protein [uncultured Methanocorpusculum sp.]
MTGIIHYRLKHSGDPFCIPTSGIAFIEIGRDPDDQSWCLEITTNDGSSFIVGKGTEEYCKQKMVHLCNAITQDDNLDMTEW